MASMDFKKWYAKVKYYNDDIEDISVRKIKTQKGNQFSPKNYKDFNSNILYSVKTAMNNMEGKEQKYYAYIGKLAGSIEELNENDKRISWPAWPSDVLDELDNTSQEERQQYITSSSILAHREKAALKKSKKRTAAEEYHKFLYNYNIDKDSFNETSDFSEQILNKTVYSSKYATKKCSQNQEELLINHNRTKTVSVALEELKNLLDEEIQKMEEKMENRSKMIEEKIETIKKQLSQACENATSKIEEILRGSLSDARTPTG